MAGVATPFSTIQYCINNKVPCCTFPLNHNKEIHVAWSKINENNFTTYLNPRDNGFAVLTGYKYVMIDYDLKEDPPHHIYEILYDNCDAVEKTPGGFHFWFLADSRTAHLRTVTAAVWDNENIRGLDIRAKGGLAFCCPSKYKSLSGEIKKYVWIKGNLSTTTPIPSEILEHLSDTTNKPVEFDNDIPETFSFNIPNDTDAITEVTTNNADETITILNGLAQSRIDNYNEWISVGIALKNSGHSCELWDEWSRKSSKYNVGECYKKWRTFTESSRPLTKASLFHWLKQDNYELFIALQGKNNDVQSKLLACTNASIADVFYSINANKYTFSTQDGWYILQDNNTWIATGSTDIMSIPNILNIIRSDCGELVIKMMHTQNRNKSEEGISKMLADSYKKICSSTFLKGVIAFLPGLYYTPGIEKNFNEKRNLFAFNNGVLDTDTFTFRPIDPDDYITITCGYDYREITDAEKVKVRAFLKKIWPNDAVLQYNLGALSKSLTGNNFEQACHVYTGRGANGKSCLMDLCKLVFGDYYQTFSASYLTKENDSKDRPLPEFAAARYARMLVTSEPDANDRFQVNLIKNMAGNEEVTFRGMYAKHPVKYIPQFKLWILTNDMPKLSKSDFGIERRMRCVYFPTKFVYNPKTENEELRDDTLTQQFRTDDSWKYGLLGLLIDALHDISGKILEMPEDVAKFTNDYMEKNNPVKAWLRKYYEITGRKNNCIKRTELYNTFLEDMSEENKIIKTSSDFYDAMEKLDIESKYLHGTLLFWGLVRKKQND